MKNSRAAACARLQKLHPARWLIRASAGAGAALLTTRRLTEYPKPPTEHGDDSRSSQTAYDTALADSSTDQLNLQAATHLARS